MENKRRGRGSATKLHFQPFSFKIEATFHPQNSIPDSFKKIGWKSRIKENELKTKKVESVDLSWHALANEYVYHPFMLSRYNAISKTALFMRSYNTKYQNMICWRSGSTGPEPPCFDPYFSRKIELILNRLASDINWMYALDEWSCISFTGTICISNRCFYQWSNSIYKTYFLW